jgi:hypothetical protein
MCESYLTQDAFRFGIAAVLNQESYHLGFVIPIVVGVEKCDVYPVIDVDVLNSTVETRCLKAVPIIFSFPFGGNSDIVGNR